MGMMNEQDLLELKQEILEAKDKVSKLKGQRELLIKQLSEKYKVKTPREGKAKLDSMRKAIDKKEEEIIQATKELEKQLKDDGNSRSEK